MTIEQIGILFTLLLTILGWVVTAYYQRKILAQQLDSEKTRDAKMLVIPERIQRLNQMRAWVDSSTEIMALKLNNLLTEINVEESERVPPSDLEERSRAWFAESTKYSGVMSMMELMYEPKRKNLGGLISKLHQNMISFMSYNTHNISNPNEFAALNQSIIETVAGLLIGIDELIELCATKELRYKR